MPVSCSVYGCTNRHIKDNPRQFFQFPIKNQGLLGLWLSAVGREDFNPTKFSKVCSDHFIETDYLVRPGTYIKRLKPDAVPTVFPNNSFYLQKKVSEETTVTKPPSDDNNLQQETIPKHEESISTELSIIDFIIGPSVSASTQTDDARRSPSPTKDILRRKIKTLKQKIRRKDKTINNLRELVKQLQDQKPVD